MTRGVFNPNPCTLCGGARGRCCGLCNKCYLASRHVPKRAKHVGASVPDLLGNPNYYHSQALRWQRAGYPNLASTYAQLAKLAEGSE